MQSWLWLPLALLSALFAALVAIFGKLGLSGLNSVSSTMVRSGVMFVILLAVTLLTGNFSGVSEIKGRAVTYIILSGAAGAASWLFYFYALKLGRAGQVVAIDRFSVVLAIGLAAIFLGEHASTKTIFGAVLITAGAILVAVG